VAACLALARRARPGRAQRAMTEAHVPGRC
jgi:hypothetical protein